RTAWGAGILGFAVLVSLAVTHRMKVRDRIRKAWEDNARAWQEYWARAYAAQNRRRGRKGSWPAAASRARMWFEQHLIGSMPDFGYVIGDPATNVASAFDP